jgi:manganese oxidase
VSVRWYVATLGDFNNANTPHWQGNTVLVAGQRTDVVVVTSAQMVTVDMVLDMAGIWLYRYHISDHMLAGMVARYEVKPRQAESPKQTGYEQHGTSGRL